MGVWQEFDFVFTPLIGGGVGDVTLVHLSQHIGAPAARQLSRSFEHTQATISFDFIYNI